MSSKTLGLDSLDSGLAPPSPTATGSTSSASKLPKEASDLMAKYSAQLCEVTLSPLWNMMGLDDESVSLRRKQVLKAVTTMAEEMHAEEEKYLDQMLKKAERLEKDRMRLAKELELEDDLGDKSDLGLYQLNTYLQEEVHRLQKRKEDIMKEVIRMKEIDEDYCRRMAEEPFYISTKFIPKKAQLEGLKVHLHDVEKTFKRKKAKFGEMQATIINYMETLEVEPETAFERDVACESDNNFTLSDVNLDKADQVLRRLQEMMDKNEQEANHLRAKITALIEKLKLNPEFLPLGHAPGDLRVLRVKFSELEVLKAERMEEFIKATRVELVDLWNQCYYGQNERNKFTYFFSVEFTEETLEKHEEEIKRLRDYYEEHEDMFLLVKKRQKLWETMLELREKANDPDRLRNARGAELLNEEKDRKRVNKFLPKVNEELRVAMHEFQERHGRPFLVGGVRYEEFLEQQEEDDRAEQEEKKAMKIKEKKQKNFHETIYGSKPVTPASKLRSHNATGMKRKVMDGTPSNNESKRMRAEQLQTRAGVRQQPQRGVKGQRTVLGEANNASIFTTGHGMNSNKKNHLNSVDSEGFFRVSRYSFHL